METSILETLITDLRSLVEAEVPERGDFKPVSARIKNSDPDIRLTHITLRVIPLPKGIEGYETKRCLEIAGLRVPLPYQSTRTILYGDKQKLIEKLDEKGLVETLISKARLLAEDLSDM